MSRQSKLKFIKMDPEIMGGKPVIFGTRVPVARIVHLLNEGYTVELIHQEYPHIDVDTISGTVNELVTLLDDKDQASKILQA